MRQVTRPSLSKDRSRARPPSVRLRGLPPARLRWALRLRCRSVYIGAHSHRTPIRITISQRDSLQVSFFASLESTPASTSTKISPPRTDTGYTLSRPHIRTRRTAARATHHRQHGPLGLLRTPVYARPRLWWRRQGITASPLSRPPHALAPTVPPPPALPAAVFFVRCFADVDRVWSRRYLRVQAVRDEDIQHHHDRYTGRSRRSGVQSDGMVWARRQHTRQHDHDRL